MVKNVTIWNSLELDCSDPGLLLTNYADLHILPNLSAFILAFSLQRLWWWSSCVNFTELKDAQRADKTLFLGVSASVFPEEISIYICKLSKDNHAHQCG